MKQEKIGQIIKEIRKNNNLTQSEFAHKYNVTYQAVSKWENGKNLPDVSVIKQICNDYNIDINVLLDGEYKKKQKNILLILIPIILIVIVVSVIFLYNNNDFNFKTIQSACDNFNISGSISYNKKKASIFISDIDYCGDEIHEKYQEIEASLYEEHDNKKVLISKSNYEFDGLITLETYLKDLVFTIDNYNSTCKDYTDNTLYIEINGITKNDTITSYKIPLSLSGC